MNIALIVFAGKGTRINSSVPKQFIRINNKEIVAYTIDVFMKHPLIDEIVLVTSQKYLIYTQNMVNTNRFNKVVNVVVGGETRQESVKKGLNSIHARNDDNVLIHDGDRPLINDKLITNCLRKLETCDAVTVAIKSDEALEGVNNLGRKYVINDIEYDIQTPQCFKFGLIKELHNRLENESFSDDASLVTRDGGSVEIINGDKYNFKVTTDRDLEFLKAEIKKMKEKDNE